MSTRNHDDMGPATDVSSDATASGDGVLDRAAGVDGSAAADEDVAGTEHECGGYEIRGVPTAMLPVLRLHDHKRAARDMFIEDCRRQSPESLRKEFAVGMGSLWGTLVHLYGADLVWIDALEEKNDTALPEPDEVGSLDELTSMWGGVDERWHAHLATLRPTGLTRRITRHSTIMKRSYTVTALDILLHVCTHQAHTIAQGRNMLRSLGQSEFPRSDLIYWAIDRSLRSGGPGG